jgi:uncharacterized coiled-coil protein SlyX
MKIHKINKHEDGRIIISIPLAVLMTLVIAIVPAITAYGAQSQKIENLEKAVNELEKDVDKLIELEKDSAVQANMIIELKEDVLEIKGYIKFIYENIQK